MCLACCSLSGQTMRMHTYWAHCLAAAASYGCLLIRDRGLLCLQKLTSCWLCRRLTGPVMCRSRRASASPSTSAHVTRAAAGAFLSCKTSPRVSELQVAGCADSCRGQGPSHCSNSGASKLPADAHCRQQCWMLPGQTHAGVQVVSDYLTAYDGELLSLRTRNQPITVFTVGPCSAAVSPALSASSQS